TNIAGAGINVAQRVMDCGDAGHILLSKHLADDLAEYQHWRPYLHDLGECEVKYGLRLHLVNLYKDNLGNSQVPEKLRRRKRWKQAPTVHPISAPRGPRFALIGALLVSTIALVVSSLIFFNRASPSMTRAPAPAATPPRAGANSREEGRGASVRKPERREGERLLRRWRAGGNVDASIQDRRLEVDLAHFDAALQERPQKLD